MAYFKFIRAILAGESIDVYNHGRMQRDFTYIDDIVEGVVRVLDHVAGGNVEWDGQRSNPGGSRSPCGRTYRQPLAG